MQPRDRSIGVSQDGGGNVRKTGRDAAKRRGGDRDRDRGNKKGAREREDIPSLKYVACAPGKAIYIRRAPSWRHASLLGNVSPRYVRSICCPA